MDEVRLPEPGQADARARPATPPPPSDPPAPVEEGDPADWPDEEPAPGGRYEPV